MYSLEKDLLSPGISGVSVGDISLGGSIESLGDGVKSGAGAEGNIAMGIGGVGISISSIEDSGVSLSISRPLGDQSLGDGVLTSAGSKGDTINIGVGSISIVVSSVGGIPGIGKTSIAVSSIEDSGISLGLSISRPLSISIGFVSI